MPRADTLPELLRAAEDHMDGAGEARGLCGGCFWFREVADGPDHAAWCCVLDWEESDRLWAVSPDTEPAAIGCGMWEARQR